jgi:immune inhibitor A
VDIPDNPTGICIFDYTIQPENGGLGVFAHEFAHDLGLPDLYDTSGNTGGAENSTAFWTLMSSGANIGDGGPDGIGDDPTDMGVWEKFQLGWLGFPGAPGGTFYQVAFAGQSSGHKLGPAEQANKQGQALFVVLPDKARLDQVTDPADGDFFYYSGMGDDMTTTMTKDFNLPAGASLTADAWFRMESGYDFAFLEVSTDGGTTFTPVETNLSTDTDLSGINGSGAGITGSSGPDWIELTADLSAYTGAVKLRFRYSTDPAVTRLGFAIDNLEVSGSELDGAEEAAAGWTFDGFKRTTGSETSFHFNAYVAENRRYVGYDKSLATAYNFGFLPDQPQKVEFYPYQDGLLLSYWDESFSDNSVGDHPGGGLILPIDMHPSFHHDASGGLLRGRILSYDSTLTLTPTDAISLHILGQPVSIGSQPAVSVFNDLNDYWFDCDEHDGQEVCTGDHPGRYQPGWTSVNVPKTGTTIRLASIDAKGFMTVLVNK